MDMRCAIEISGMILEGKKEIFVSIQGLRVCCMVWKQILVKLTI